MRKTNKKDNMGKNFNGRKTIESCIEKLGNAMYRTRVTCNGYRYSFMSTSLTKARKIRTSLRNGIVPTV